MRVLNKYRDQLPEGAVSIMRPGFWGNPYSVGKDGDRDEVLRKYRQWFDLMLSGPLGNSFLDALKQLSQAPALVCCCKPKACHGDIIVEKMLELNLLQKEEHCGQGSLENLG